MHEHGRQQAARRVGKWGAWAVLQAKAGQPPKQQAWSRRCAYLELRPDVPGQLVLRVLAWQHSALQHCALLAAREDEPPACARACVCVCVCVCV